MRIYFDTEFTGLHQGTTLVSIGCVAANGRTFYAELTDYDESQVNGWLKDNVIAHLRYAGHSATQIVGGANEVWRGDQVVTKAALSAWLQSFGEPIEMWSDCLAYDWVLFCQLFGGAFGIPECVYYIPFDLATLLKVKGIDPDISRAEMADQPKSLQHNALDDAWAIRLCVERLEEACGKACGKA